MLWLLDYFSDMLIHTITIVGIIATLIAFLIPNNPYTGQYQIPFKIISVIVLCLGIFFEGTVFKDNVWEARVAEAEKRALKAEKEAAEANGKIHVVYVTKKQQYQEIKQAVNEQIKQDAKKINETCVVAPEVNAILNASANNQKPGVQK